MAAAQLLLRALLLGPVDDGVEQLGKGGWCQELDDDVAQLTLGQSVVDDELLVDDSVVQPHKPDCEVFASIAVSTLPGYEL